MQANQTLPNPATRDTSRTVCGRMAGERSLATLLMAVFLWVFSGAGVQASRELESVADLADKLQASVVNISTTQTIRGPKGVPLPRVPEGSPFEELFKDFFNNQRRQGESRRVSSLGSGFVLDESGLIVTNNHVIEEADEIIVNFNDGQKLKVEEIVGRDSKTDLALLRVKPKKPLTPVSFGDSSVMRVGDWVMAIGNPFGLGGTVTVGIISAKKRDINAGPYDEFLQTDAAINRGNSGGPLFNMAGEVIGINTAIISPTGGSIGIGFAHPANAALHVIEQLRKYGEARRGWLGVRIQTVTEAIAESRGMDEPGGALVAKVLEDSPAAMAGIELGDVIVRFDGKEIDSMRALPRAVAQTEIGRTVEIEVMRDNERKTFQVAVGRLSEETVASRTPEAEPEEEQDEEATALLGLSIAPLSDELRSRYGIDSKVKGVVVVEVDPNSAAARNDIRPGNVIMEVTNTKVSKPADVSARVDEVRRMGRLNVQLLINDGEDNLRFVAVPIDED